jgi:hypothetical protein
VDVDLANDTGIDGDNVTSDPGLVITGDDPGNTVEYSTDGGTSWDPALPTWVEGLNKVDVHQVDPLSGKESPPTHFEFTLDTQLSAAPFIVAMSNDYLQSSDNDAQLADQRTSASAVTLSGTGEIGATISIRDSANIQLARAVVDSQGVWQARVDVSGLVAVDESLALTATQTDLAGNGPSAVSDEFTLTRERAVLDLTGLTPVDSIVIRGDNEFDFAGGSVSAAGDIDGDGYDDFIVGAAGAADVGGETYVIFGRAGGFDGIDAATGQRVPGVIDLSALSPADGFIIRGSSALEENAGNSVSTAGDINGDGYDDLIVGLVWAINDGIGAYVIFGDAGGVGELESAGQGRRVLELARLDPASGFIIQDDDRDLARASVSNAGDINGDDYDDLIVGAYGGDDNNRNAGEAYVIVGKNGGWGAPVETAGVTRQVLDLRSLAPADGFIIQGAAENDLAGWSVSSAGDINHDGYDDLIVGAYGANNDRNGGAYVIFGKSGGFGEIDNATGRQVLDLSRLAPADGFIIQGDTKGGRAGYSVSNADDVNHDGYDDLIVGAPFANKTFVIFGKAGGSGYGTVDATGRQVLDLSSLAPADGFIIQADAAGDSAGESVSAAGDINGDGYGDLIVGAPYGDDGGDNAGEAYVIFGKAGGFGAIDATGRQVLDLSSLAPVDGFIIQADAAMDNAGESVSAAGDINGDGYDDLMVGAPFNSADGDYAGRAYVIYGRADFSHGYSGGIMRTGGNGLNGDWLSGSDQADVLDGGGGDRDVLLGHADNDLLILENQNFRRVDGGEGTDTLRISGSGVVFDFTALAEGAVTGIEKIDLDGVGANQLTLRFQDVLAIPDIDQLIIDGGADDTVNVIGFAATGLTFIDLSGGVYDHYSASDGTNHAVLLIEQGMLVQQVV